MFICIADTSHRARTYSLQIHYVVCANFIKFQPTSSKIKTLQSRKKNIFAEKNSKVPKNWIHIKMIFYKGTSLKKIFVQLCIEIERKKEKLI